MKRWFYAVIFIALTIALTVFIFSNSLQVAEESTKKSDVLVDIVNGFCSLFNTTLDYDLLSTIIRKLGHFAEYFSLGVTASSALYFCFYKTKVTVFSPIYCLLTAICDEFICQRITEGRSPEWRDVCIDSTGAVLGTVAVLLLIFYLKRSGRKGEKV